MNRPISACALILLLFTLISALAQNGGTDSLDPKLASSTDLKVPGGAILLQVQRQLATGQPQRGLLGTRWRMNWESHLSRNRQLAQIEDWAGTVSFMQAGEQPEYTNASGERVTFTPDGRAVHTTPDGGSESFDATGRLVERTYHHGNKAVLHYTAQGRLSRVEGPGASFLQFTSDSVGHVIQVEGSTGATVHYTYDKDNLTQVQINGGPPLRYGYDTQGSLVRIEDPQTGSLEIAYDVKGRVTSYRWADGSEQRFEYDDATHTKRVIEPNGATTVTLEIPEERRTEVTDPLGNKIAIQFDEAGRPVSVTGPANASSRMSYDALGRIVAGEDALGHTMRYEYAGESTTLKAIIQPDGTRQEFEYDNNKDLTAVKIGGKIVSALAYNPNGSIASAKEPGTKERKFTYYPNGLVKSEANALGEATQFEYDRRGNLVRETNPLGGVTLRSFDPQDRLITLTNPAGGTTRYEYDNRGRLIRQVDPAGGVSSFEYDVRGRLSAQTNPADQVTRYEYSLADKLIKTTWPDHTAETYRYDLAANLIEQTDRLGRTFKFERDPLGQVTRERLSSGLELRYRYDSAGNRLAIEDSGGSKNLYQTDALGRDTTLVSATGGKTQFQYDPLGNLRAVIDPLGRTKQFAYTADGDLTQASEASRDEARYEYDAAGRVVAIHRPSGGVTRLAYDRMGNLLTVTDPLGNMKSYTYDNGGRLLSFKDAANRVTRYVYDKAGQTIEKQLPGGKRVAYKYDALGRMIEADDGAFPVRLSYDPAGNLKQVEYAAIHQVLVYEYDAQGLRTKMIAPDGRETRYEYDALKRLAAVVPPGDKQITFGYDEKNRMQSVAYPNGITGRWVYDADGQLVNISYKDRTGKTVAGSWYRYDPAGNPVERQDTPGRTSRFAYDPAGQVVEETNPDAAVKYAYSAGGNRASVTEGAQVDQYKYDAADRIITAGAEQLSYDANGNLISRRGPGGVTTYEYDAENQLVKVATPDGATTTYGYAPTGERVWRRDQSGVTYFLYDGLNLIAELGSDLHTKTTYVHSLGIDRPLAMLQENQSYYYAADRLGSITHLTDDNGKVAAAYSYDAFGNIKTKQGTVANPFAFIGRELEPNGLYYFRARYYDAALGRFVSEDSTPAPLDEPLEQNPYLYARNNPIRFVDPLGLNWFSPEYLQGQSDEDLYLLYKMYDGKGTPDIANQIFNVMRSRGITTPALESWHIAGKLGARSGLPPWVGPKDSMFPRAGGAAQWEGRPGGWTPPKPNVPAAGAEAGSSAPGPGLRPAGNASDTGVVKANNPFRGGNTQQVAAAGAGAAEAGSSGNFWNLNPSSVRPGFLGAASVASLMATAADCYNAGLANCGPKVAGGLAIGALAKWLFPKAAPALGTVGILVHGAMSWWQVGKEALNQRIDSQQRDQQEQARLAAAQALIDNRNNFTDAVKALRAEIEALKEDQANLNAKTSQAQQELNAANDALDQAKSSLGKLRDQAKGLDASKLCNPDPRDLNSQCFNLAWQAESASDSIGSLLDEANQLYLDCETAPDEGAAKQKAADIRAKYESAKKLAQSIPGWKTEAQQKNDDLNKSLQAINDFKSKLAEVNATKAEITNALARVHKASANLEGLFNGNQLNKGIRQLTSNLDASAPKFRARIGKLEDFFPAGMPKDMQDQLADLYDLVTSVTKHDPPVDFYQKSLDLEAQGSPLTKSMNEIKGLDAAIPCDGATSGDAAIPRIDSALQKAQDKINNDSDLPKLAQICEASAKCIPLINQARQLFEQLQIEDGQAAMEQARQAGCNVEGLQTALDYYTSIRDAVALLNSARDQCKFQEGLDFAQKFPQSIQNNSFVANAMSQLTAGLAAQQQVEQLLTQSANALARAVDLARGPVGDPVWGGISGPSRDCKESDRLAAEADGFLAQAYQLAASYPCLSPRIDKYKSEYDKLKAQKQPCSSDTSAKPTDTSGVAPLPEDQPGPATGNNNTSTDNNTPPNNNNAPGDNNGPANNNAPPATSSTSDSGGFWNAAKAAANSANSKIASSVQQLPEDTNTTPPNNNAPANNPNPGQSIATALSGVVGTVNVVPGVEGLPEDIPQNQPPPSNNPPPNVESIPEDTARPSPPPQTQPPTEAGNSSGGSNSPPASQNSQKPPGDFWKKLGTAIGTAIAEAQNQPRSQPPPPPPPNQGGGPPSRGQNPPPRSGGNTGSGGGTPGSTGGQGIDLSGTWSATYTVPMTGQPCRFQMVLSRVAAGQWQGPLDYACDENPHAASGPPIHFKTQATIQISGPGRIHLSYNSPQDGPQQADGTYNNSQMNFGGSAGVTYTRR